MIWIVSTCKEKLNELEFVKPVAEIAKKFDAVRIISMDEIPGNGKVIISGTALKDFEYLKYVNKFSWIEKRSVLGICSGAQIIAKIYKIDLKPVKKIGVFEIETTDGRKIKSYFLTSFLAEKNKYSLAFLDGYSAILKIADKYAVFFHPEVLNPQIIENFLEDRPIL